MKRLLRAESCQRALAGGALIRGDCLLLESSGVESHWERHWVLTSKRHINIHTHDSQVSITSMAINHVKALG